MEPDKDNSTPESDSKQAQQAPADALSKTPEELDQEETEQKAASNEPTPEPEKKISPIKRLFKKVNVYFLIFLLLVIVVVAITIVNYLNSQRVPAGPDVADQSLSEEALRDLANNDATVGNTSQTLTIQGNAIIAGQTLARGNLNVAGNLQTGGSIQGPSITISGEANLGQTQIDSLQVANDTAVEGSTTLRDLSVSGQTSLSGAVTASQITVTRLILSGNASLEVPNHVSFTGPSPSRSITQSVLGGSGSASVNGSDTAGTININTGNNPTVGCFIRITFRQAFSNQPHVVISPVGSAAGKLQYYVDRDTSGFSICTNSAAEPNKSFSFDYFVTN